MTLLNNKQLAAELGRKPQYICAMKAAGYVMRFGNRDTLANAMLWLQEHPEFRSTAYHRKQKEVAA